MSGHFKVQTYIPESHLNLVKEELNKIITPIFPHYDFVFSWHPVNGSWRPLAGSNAYQGEIGKIEIATEMKLEFTIVESDLQNVFATIKKFHPYEQPVIEAFAVLVK